MPNAFFTFLSETAPWYADERRGEARFPCDLTTLCQPADGDITHSLWLADVRDISSGGLRLSLPCFLQPGALLTVEIPSADAGQPSFVQVRVVHAAAEVNGGWSLGCAYVGSLSRDEKRDIGALIADTARTAPQMPVSADSHTACLVAIYPTGPAMGARYRLDHTAMQIGREDACGVRLADHTVSRRHARIDAEPEGYRITDMGSTNGTFVNDRRVSSQLLSDGDYLRLGGCIFRFLAGGNVELQYHEELYRLSIYDGLTGIYNRRFFIESLQRELTRAGRQGRAVALVLFDIDHFKTINDSLGHLGGDFTLQRLAQRLKDSIRNEEVFARYGGEEFAVLLADGSPEQASELGERLRRLVADQPFCYADQEYSVTISAGVAHTGGSTSRTAQELLQQADDNLYRAKAQGRNCVVTSGGISKVVLQSEAS
jgi:two-component system cell cycle response regulator